MMKFKLSVLALIGLWAVAALRVSLGAEQTPRPRSVWDGVFTEDQATRGEATFQKICSECHGTDLAGDGFAPALSGSEFVASWNGATVGDLFERIRISMPPSDPLSVSSQGKADIIAFVLSYNKFPAGKTELAPQTEQLKTIKFEATKP